MNISARLAPKLVPISFWSNADLFEIITIFSLRNQQSLSIFSKPLKFPMKIFLIQNGNVYILFGLNDGEFDQTEQLLAHFKIFIV